MNAYQIAAMAEVATPDSPTSPGAEWLGHVYRDALDMLDGLDPSVSFDDVRDDIPERADGMVPIYTHNRWQVFVDLCAYQEEVDDLGDGSDLTTLAGTALYMIAERIYHHLVDQAEEADNEEE